jgi:uncharacterized tellurite resistance protein B-like protein
MEFDKLKENIMNNINKISRTLDKNQKIDEEDIIYMCPYCENGTKNGFGYYTCTECNNNYRIYNESIYRDEETINDIIYYFIKLLAHMCSINGEISNKKLDYIYYLVKEEIKLDLNKIKWCAIIFKEASNEIYTSEVIKKFKSSLKKYYGYNYNIERLSVFKWVIDIYNIDSSIYENQDRILNDYIKIFNISEVDYIYINYSEVSASKE